MTLASIVEKETGKSDERPRVAGVFVNRLQKHMKLQSDPTIVYGLVFGKGTLGHSITRAELQEATPYNTYFIDGLPPGPICNPGRAAMEAVANPAHGRDLYFVADGTGGHAFAETLDQHQKNVVRWRQIEKDAQGLQGSPEPRRRAARQHPRRSAGYAAAAATAAHADTTPSARSRLRRTPAAPTRLRARRPARPGRRVPAQAAGADRRRRLLSAAKLGKRGDRFRGGDSASTIPRPAPTTPALRRATTSRLRFDARRFRRPRSPTYKRPRRPASATAKCRRRQPRRGRSGRSDRAGDRRAGGPHARAFDASEGTTLDPLRNRT